MDDSNKQFFLESINQYMDIKEEDLVEEFSGIRPKLQRDGEEVKDFIIREESDKGFPGLINLIGIESPGLTSSLAIAIYVANLIKGDEKNVL